MSTRHHYLPKFVIKGFQNSKGLLFIYDKTKDEINSKPRSPKSIFFENNRNTINVTESEYSSIIEDELFKKLDDNSSKILKLFQEKEITEDLLNVKNQGEFQFFIINLFWRLPYTDFAFKDLIRRATISTSRIDPEVLRNDESFQKLERTGLYKNTINQLDNKLPPQSHHFIKLIEFESDMFILGDNPILFKSIPTEFTDLVYLDYFFAVSSKRIFSTSQSEIVKFKSKMCYDFNAQIIDQSIKYVVSGNLKLLEDSVKYYRKLKEANLIKGIRGLLFNFNMTDF